MLEGGVGRSQRRLYQDLESGLLVLYIPDPLGYFFLPCPQAPVETKLVSDSISYCLGIGR